MQYLLFLKWILNNFPSIFSQLWYNNLRDYARDENARPIFSQRFEQKVGTHDAISKRRRFHHNQKLQA